MESEGSSQQICCCLMEPWRGYSPTYTVLKSQSFIFKDSNSANHSPINAERVPKIYKSKAEEKLRKASLAHWLKIWNPSFSDTQHLWQVSILVFFMSKQNIPCGHCTKKKFQRWDLPFIIIPSGMVSRAAIVLLMGLLGMVYQGTQLPPNDSAITPVVSPRIRLRDGRYMAYRERGVPKEKAKHSIIIVHGFGSSKDMNFQAPQVHASIFLIFFLKTCLYIDLKIVVMVFDQWI